MPSGGSSGRRRADCAGIAPEQSTSRSDKIVCHRLRYRSAMAESHVTAVVAVLAAAALFGTTGAAQALGPAGASPLAIGSVRLVLGALALAAIAAARRPGGARRRWAMHGPALLVGGVAVAVYQLGWFAGLRRTGVAVGTVVGIGSGPVMAGILQIVRRHRVPSRGWAAGSALTIVGAGLLARRGVAGTSADALGLSLILGAVMGYVVFVEAAGHAIERGLDSAGAMAGMFAIGALLLTPVIAMESVAWLSTTRGALMAIHLGFATIGIAYTLYGWGLRHLTGPAVVTLTLAEPLTAAVLATLVLGERLGALNWCGGVLIAIGLLFAARGELRPTEMPDEGRPMPLQAG
jgi:drug/metabolite transporter, DME family